MQNIVTNIIVFVLSVSAQINVVLGNTHRQLVASENAHAPIFKYNSYYDGAYGSYGMRWANLGFTDYDGFLIDGTIFSCESSAELGWEAITEESMCQKAAELAQDATITEFKSCKNNPFHRGTQRVGNCIYTTDFESFHCNDDLIIGDTVFITGSSGSQAYMVGKYGVINLGLSQMYDDGTEKYYPVTIQGHNGPWSCSYTPQLNARACFEQGHGEWSSAYGGSFLFKASELRLVPLIASGTKHDFVGVGEMAHVNTLTECFAACNADGSAIQVSFTESGTTLNCLCKGYYDSSNTVQDPDWNIYANPGYMHSYSPFHKCGYTGILPSQPEVNTDNLAHSLSIRVESMDDDSNWRGCYTRGNGLRSVGRWEYYDDPGERGLVHFNKNPDQQHVSNCNTRGTCYGENPKNYRQFCQFKCVPGKYSDSTEPSYISNFDVLKGHDDDSYGMYFLPDSYRQSYFGDPARTDMYAATKLCKSCPVGQYQNEPGLNQCKSCPIGRTGKASATVRDTESNSCEPCPSLTYWDADGCHRCPYGTFFTNENGGMGLSSCKECTSRSDGNGQCKCDDPSGLYVPRPFFYPVTGTCEQCSDHPNCPIKFDILLCPAGQYQNFYTSATCKACPQGKYTDLPGQSSCKQCAEGEINLQDGATTCTKCQPGEYAKANTTYLRSVSKCATCVVGTYTDQSGQTSCKQCALGKYADQSGQTSCKECGKAWTTDHRQSVDQSSCRQCTVGEENEPCGCTIKGKEFNMVDGTCSDCSSGDSCGSCYGKDRFWSSDSNMCECPVSHYAIARVFENNTLPRYNVHDCKKCEIGHFTSGGGDKTTCERCMWDQEGPGCGCLWMGKEFKYGQCRPCLAGSKPCGSCYGDDRTQDGHNHNCTCPPQHEYIETLLGMDGQPQTFANSALIGELEWEWANYTTRFTRKDCQPCQAACKESNDAADVCRYSIVQDHCECAYNHYEGNDKLCHRCPTGSYNNWQDCLDCVRATDSSECYPCQNGQYQMQIYETSELNSMGRPVTVMGIWNSDDHRTALGCQVCTHGFEINGISRKCDIPCQKGFYSDATTQSMCTECPIGKYADELGTGACKVCPSNMVGIRDAASRDSVENACVKCPERHFMGGSPYTCIPCDEGFITIGDDRTTCHPCPEWSCTNGANVCLRNECPFGFLIKTWKEPDEVDSYYEVTQPIIGENSVFAPVREDTINTWKKVLGPLPDNYPTSFDDKICTKVGVLSTTTGTITPQCKLPKLDLQHVDSIRQHARHTAEFVDDMVYQKYLLDPTSILDTGGWEKTRAVPFSMDYAHHTGQNFANFAKQSSTTTYTFDGTSQGEEITSRAECEEAAEWVNKFIKDEHHLAYKRSVAATSRPDVYNFKTLNLEPNLNNFISHTNQPHAPPGCAFDMDGNLYFRDDAPLGYQFITSDDERIIPIRKSVYNEVQKKAAHTISYGDTVEITCVDKTRYYVSCGKNSAKPYFGWTQMNVFNENMEPIDMSTIFNLCERSSTTLSCPYPVGHSDGIGKPLGQDEYLKFEEAMSFRHGNDKSLTLFGPSSGTDDGQFSCQDGDQSCTIFVVCNPMSTDGTGAYHEYATGDPGRIEFSTVATFNDAPDTVWGGSFGSSVPNNVKSESIVTTQITGQDATFAGIRKDGSVATWGNTAYSAFDVAYNASDLKDKTTLVGTDGAFVAYKSYGSAVAWGATAYGGKPSYSNSMISSATESLEFVIKVVSTDRAFAAILADGVAVWGLNSHGGDYSSVASQLARENIIDIASTDKAFAALKDDGSVVVWGGGDGSDVSSVASELSGGVNYIYSTDRAFAALKTDGSVVAWGWSDEGGDASSVASELTEGVVSIYSTASAFAALKANGSVVVWGDPSEGGVNPTLTQDVTEIVSSRGAFAALKADGSVVVWGNSLYGADFGTHASGHYYTDNVVTNIFSTDKAFAAILASGSVIAWGHNNYGGDLTSSLRYITNIVSTDRTFTAISDSSKISMFLDKVNRASDRFEAITSRNINAFEMTCTNNTWQSSRFSCQDEPGSTDKSEGTFGANVVTLENSNQANTPEGRANALALETARNELESKELQLQYIVQTVDAASTPPPDVNSMLDFFNALNLDPRYPVVASFIDLVDIGLDYLIAHRVNTGTEIGYQEMVDYAVAIARVSYQLDLSSQISVWELAIPYDQDTGLGGTQAPITADSGFPILLKLLAVGKKCGKDEFISPSPDDMTDYSDASECARDHFLRPHDVRESDGYAVGAYLYANWNAEFEPMALEFQDWFITTVTSDIDDMLTTKLSDAYADIQSTPYNTGKKLSAKPTCFINTITSLKLGLNHNCANDDSALISKYVENTFDSDRVKDMIESAKKPKQDDIANLNRAIADMPGSSLPTAEWLVTNTIFGMEATKFYGRGKCHLDKNYDMKLDDNMEIQSPFVLRIATHSDGITCPPCGTMPVHDIDCCRPCESGTNIPNRFPGSSSCKEICTAMIGMEIIDEDIHILASSDASVPDYVLPAWKTNLKCIDTVYGSTNIKYYSDIDIVLDSSCTSDQLQIQPPPGMGCYIGSRIIDDSDFVNAELFDSSRAHACWKGASDNFCALTWDNEGFSKQTMNELGTYCGSSKTPVMTKYAPNVKIPFFHMVGISGYRTFKDENYMDWNRAYAIPYTPAGHQSPLIMEGFRQKGSIFDGKRQALDNVRIVPLDEQGDKWVMDTNGDIQPLLTFFECGECTEIDNDAVANGFDCPVHVDSPKEYKTCKNWKGSNDILKIPIAIGNDENTMEFYNNLNMNNGNFDLAWDNYGHNYLLPPVSLSHQQFLSDVQICDNYCVPDTRVCKDRGNPPSLHACDSPWSIRSDETERCHGNEASVLHTTETCRWLGDIFPGTPTLKYTEASSKWLQDNWAKHSTNLSNIDFVELDDSLDGFFNRLNQLEGTNMTDLNGLSTELSAYVTTYFTTQKARLQQLDDKWGIGGADGYCGKRNAVRRWSAPTQPDPFVNFTWQEDLYIDGNTINCDCPQIYDEHGEWIQDDMNREGCFIPKHVTYFPFCHAATCYSSPLYRAIINNLREYNALPPRRLSSYISHRPKYTRLLYYISDMLMATNEYNYFSTAVTRPNLYIDESTSDDANMIAVHAMMKKCGDNVDPDNCVFNEHPFTFEQVWNITDEIKNFEAALLQHVYRYRNGVQNDDNNRYNLSTIEYGDQVAVKCEYECCDLNKPGPAKFTFTVSDAFTTAMDDVATELYSELLKYVPDDIGGQHWDMCTTDNGLITPKNPDEICKCDTVAWDQATDNYMPKDFDLIRFTDANNVQHEGRYRRLYNYRSRISGTCGDNDDEIPLADVTVDICQRALWNVKDKENIRGGGVTTQFEYPYSDYSRMLNVIDIGEEYWYESLSIREYHENVATGDKDFLRAKDNGYRTQWYSHRLWNAGYLRQQAWMNNQSMPAYFPPGDSRTDLQPYYEWFQGPFDFSNDATLIYHGLVPSDETRWQATTSPRIDQPFLRPADPIFPLDTPDLLQSKRWLEDSIPSGCSISFTEHDIFDLANLPDNFDYNQRDWIRTLSQGVGAVEYTGHDNFRNGQSVYFNGRTEQVQDCSYYDHKNGLPDPFLRTKVFPCVCPLNNFLGEITLNNGTILQISNLDQIEFAKHEFSIVSVDEHGNNIADVCGKTRCLLVDDIANSNCSVSNAATNDACLEELRTSEGTRLSPDAYYAVESNQFMCSSCPPGYYLHTSGICAKAHTQCANGTSPEFPSNDNGECISCDRLHRLDYSKQCTLCDGGIYHPEYGTNLGGNTKDFCSVCLNNHVPNEQNTGCDACPSGTDRGIGKMAGRDSFDPRVCQTCLPGKFNDVSGQTCQNCPRGYVSNASYTGCNACPPGKGQYGPQCLECEQGQFNNGIYEIGICNDWTQTEEDCKDDYKMMSDGDAYNNNFDLGCAAAPLRFCTCDNGQNSTEYCREAFVISTSDNADNTVQTPMPLPLRNNNPGPLTNIQTEETCKEAAILLQRYNPLTDSLTTITSDARPKGCFYNTATENLLFNNAVNGGNCSPVFECIFQAMDDCTECNTGFELANIPKNGVATQNFLCEPKSAFFGYAFIKTSAVSNCEASCIKWYGTLEDGFGTDQYTVPEQGSPECLVLLNKGKLLKSHDCTGRRLTGANCHNLRGGC